MPDEKAKLLVIDDDESIRKVLTVTLRDGGYEVLAAEDGEEGLKIFAEEQPDIILCDLRMPGKDGISVLKEIKARDPDKEVIVISAYADMDLAIKALQLKASDFITKPISTTAFQSTRYTHGVPGSNQASLLPFAGPLPELWYLWVL